MPFPAVPNDVDIIHFGNDPTYQKAIDLMVNSEYQEVKGQADAQQTMFHDIKYGGLQHPHPPKKDVYDIDLYQKISASQLVYLEKSKLKNNVVQKPFQNIEVNGLRNYAELMVIIIHSIIPEMIFTLFVYYTTLHYIEKMDKIEINNFVKLVQENNITNSAKAHFALVAELHNQAYGFIPEKIQYIIDALGSNKKEVDNFLKSGLKMPYNYRLYTVFKIIIEKAKSAEFRKSIFNQIWYSLRPKNFFWVVHNIFLRSRRDTY
jgi:hypothetical protein